MMATLPVEVEERIIDKLHYHVDALQNCALTCRHWRPRTRYHLFAAIRVTTKDELLLLYTLLSRSPHLLPLVRSLTIRAELDKPEVAQLFQMVPVPLFTSLSNLVCWRFCGTRTGRNSLGEWDYTSAPAYHRTGLATIRRLATTVGELHLIKMSFIAPVDCARLVSSMPALRNLRCVDVGFRMPQNHEVVDTCIDRLAPSLHVASLSLINVQAQVADLLLRLLQSTVETLTFDVRMAVNDPTLSFISRLERLSLLNLQLQMTDSFTGGIELAANILKSLVNLHALTIELEHESCDLAGDGYGSIWDPETAEVCQQFEESSIRLNPSRVLFVVRSDWRARTVYWTQTLQHMFSTLHKQCPLRVQCQRDLQDKQLYGHDRAVVALAASPDGRWIASTSDDRTLIIWRVYRGDGGTIQHVQVALDWSTEYTFYQLQFSPDSRYLASFGNPQETDVIRIWGVTTGTLLGTLGGLDRKWGACMAWLQDGSLIASMPDSQRLLRWCTVPPKECPGPSLTTPPSLAVPPDATYSITDRGLVQLADRDRPTETLYKDPTHVLFSPDGSQLVLRFDNGSVLMWDTDFGTVSLPRQMELSMAVDFLGYPVTIAVSDLAKKFLIVFKRDYPCYIIVDRVESDAPATSHGKVTSRGVFDGPLKRAWFSPCGRLVATCMMRSTGVVHLWRGPNDGMHLASCVSGSGDITEALFTQDSQTLVHGDSDGTVHVRAIENLDMATTVTQ